MLMMDSHPFIRSRFRMMVVVGVLVLIAFTQGVLLIFYCRVEFVSAWVDSSVSTLLLGVFGFLLWYIVGFLRVFQAEILLTLFVLFVWMISSYVGQYLGDMVLGVNQGNFVQTIPVRFVVGLSSWVILLQWYRILLLREWKEERVATESLQRMQADDLTDRIAVKDGTRIHIIRLEELIYVQASGDYVTLFTASGQYLKEQTMKFLETHLPSNRFIRIHRSYLVNVEQIHRVELYGKETYHVFLKNGAQLRASSAGYKLLKEKLAI